MRNLNKAYFISDIHGFIEGLEQAEKVCTPSEPLYILGDLFDHKYGDEKQMIDLIIMMIDEQRCNLIMGNHDEVLFLIFFRFLDDQTLNAELSHHSLNKVATIFKTLFDESFYTSFISLIEQFTLDLDLDNYYKKVTELALQENYKQTYDKVKRLYESSSRFETISIGSTKLLLNHCGSNKRPDCIDIVTTNYQAAVDVDYVVMGHLTIPYVEEFIQNIDNSVVYNKFIVNPKFDGLQVSESILYNSYNKAIMIDDGSHTNLVTIEAT
ncbi:metallophosphoesterase [Mollicutes bacterium LVI A0078]|nr:metallophosphoesterase [Mollicutes bacterium LVI A0075]WOO90945.1 metallophosphoesterase [Mollicutes bacterium LVI A0078]